MLDLKSEDIKGFRFVLPTEKETMMSADWDIARVTFPDVEPYQKNNVTVCCDVKRKIYRAISEVEYYSDKVREMDDWHYNLILRDYNRSNSPFKNMPVYIG